MVIFQPKIDDTRMINKKRTGEKSQWNLPQIFFYIRQPVGRFYGAIKSLMFNGSTFNYTYVCIYIYMYIYIYKYICIEIFS